MPNNWNPAFSIRDSSLMDTPPYTRLVFLMLLHAKDREGFVEMGRGAKCLARFCNIDVEHAEEAIRILTSPDPDSKDSENDGRRIAFVDRRGWKVLNSDKYNERAQRTKHQDQAREFMRRKRAALKGDVVQSCTALYDVAHVNVNVHSTPPVSRDTCPPTTPENQSAKALFEHYKARIQPNARLCPTDKIRARLKTFSVDELTQAIDRFAADAWWMEHNACRGAAWFFHSDSRIEQLINLIPRKDTRNGKHQPASDGGAGDDPYAGFLWRPDSDGGRQDAPEGGAPEKTLETGAGA